MGRLRGLLWLTAGLVVALLAGAVAFITLSKATAQAANQHEAVAKAPVVVAARAVSVCMALTNEDLALKEMPSDTVPEGAVRTMEEALGKITLVDLYAGEVVLMQRLVDPNVVATDARMALVVAEDKVLMAFPAQDLLTKVEMLRPGDHVDILYSVEVASKGASASLIYEPGAQKGYQKTFDALQNVTISAVVQGTKKATGQAGQEAILLAVSPQDALVLKYLKDFGGIPDLVLRAPGAEKPLTVDPVDGEYIVNRYRIPANGPGFGPAGSSSGTGTSTSTGTGTK